MANTQSTYSNRDILEFFLDSGIDCALEETSQDRFLETEKALSARKAQMAARQNQMAAPQANPNPQNGINTGTGAAKPEFNRLQSAKAQAAPTQNAMPNTAVPNEETLKRASEVAQKAANLEDLNLAVQNFEGCNLKGTAKHTILGEGNANADVMLICDAPGRDEDLTGRPFVGEAGILLDRMLASIGLTRESIYIAHIIPWRPPGNRQPTPFENALCRPFVERQIELIKPKHIVLIGAASAKTMLNTNDSIVRLRGKWKEMNLNEQTYSCITMFHPQYLLRQPMQKKLAWKDLLSLKSKIVD